MPVTLPVWFAAFDHHVYVRTPEKTRKVERVRRDPRATFLVERGDRWVELCAVMLYADVELLPPGAEADAVVAALDAKYANFRITTEKLPDATRAHYAVQFEILKLTPTGRLVTWDNSRLSLD
jgi:Pyridoxamine 5'-phosphate oxidase